MYKETRRGQSSSPADPHSLTPPGKFILRFLSTLPLQPSKSGGDKKNKKQRFTQLHTVCPFPSVLLSLSLRSPKSTPLNPHHKPIHSLPHALLSESLAMSSSCSAFTSSRESYSACSR